MAVYVVGDFIRETRLRKGYTQEDVSFGICTPASLSRIENGVQMPGRFTLEKLLERLGTENNLFNMFVSREEMELYQSVQAMIRNITDGDIVELEQQIDKVDKLTKNASELERQCLLFAKGELLKQRDGDTESAMELFMKAIHITLPKFDGKTPLKSNLLTFDEITIINSNNQKLGEYLILNLNSGRDIYLYGNNHNFTIEIMDVIINCMNSGKEYRINMENCQIEACQLGEHNVLSGGRTWNGN